MTLLAKKRLNPSFFDFAIGVGIAPSGVNFITFGPRTYTFGTFLNYTNEFKKIPFQDMKNLNKIFGPIHNL